MYRKNAANAGKPMHYMFICLILSVAVFCQTAYGQQYGLSFSGAEVPQYQRTSMALNEGNYFSLRDNFRINFQLSYPPGLLRYYGYILRMVDDNNQNIDLIFNYRDISTTSLNVIYGKEQTNILLETSLATLLDRWVDLGLAYDRKNLTLTFFSEDTTIVAENIQLSHKVKFFFGRNNYEHIRTVDVPPMKVRDVKLFKGKKLLHHWPLNESTGDIATDIIKGNIAQIENPTWVRRLFQNWEKIYVDSITGQAAVTFDAVHNRLYFPGQQELITLNVADKRTEKFAYERFSDVYLWGRQALYDYAGNRLILFNIWNNTFQYFDSDSLLWQDMNTGTNSPAVFWHYNKYFSSKNNEVLVFGGYGQYEFQNIVQRFSFSSKKYDTLTTKGDVYHPRYLAALGEMNDTIYLLGGHGSVSGKQIESPTEFFDLTLFSLKDNSFIKRYEFEPPVPDAVFANSMFIHPDNDSFYALAFPYFEHFGYLQLVRGSLYEPGFELVGDRIPFQFEDISSFADLYFSKSMNKMIAVTLYYNRTVNQSNITVYTISYPPDIMLADTTKHEKSSNRPALIIVIGLLLFIAGAALYLIIKRRSNRQNIISMPNELPSIDTTADNSPETATAEEITYKNTILFFGGFKIFNRQSVDITNKFSPLLKEIFLLIWLNSFEGNNGVSSEKLKELFWFDKDDKKAMNNRAVNIAKLKSLLEEIDSCKLSRKTGYWKIEMNDRIVNNDYIACLKIAHKQKPLSKCDILKLLKITNKGSFLEDLSYEWLDAFKADVSNTIIDTLVDFGLSYDIHSDPDFILNLADAVFYFDIINEEAMILKCKSLNIKGKHSLANKTYQEFIKNYKSLYDCEFEKPFTEIIR